MCVGGGGEGREGRWGEGEVYGISIFFRHFNSTETVSLT